LLSSALARSAAGNLHLLHQLVRRDFTARFAGSALGLAWAVLQPLSLVTLYWVVFTVFIPRGPGSQDPGYVYFLIAGLIPWIGLSDGIMRSTTSVVDNAAIVRRLAFRSESLVIVPNVSAILFELIGIALFVIFLAFTGRLSAMLWVLPVAVLMQLVLQTGVGWFLAAMYVFFRDLVQVIGFLLSVVFYLSPILYSVSPRLEVFFNWNPLTPLLGLFRSALLGSTLPPTASIVFLVAVAFLAFFGGLQVFRRTRSAIADLI
jgi:lipopolysaccharide transport system permease protein